MRALLIVIVGICLLIPMRSAIAESRGVPGEHDTDQSPKRSPKELAAWIDERFQESWKSQGIEPAPATNDAEFVRRAFLDLIGRIPSVAEVRGFLDDSRLDKRQSLDRKSVV